MPVTADGKSGPAILFDGMPDNGPASQGVCYLVSTALCFASVHWDAFQSFGIEMAMEDPADMNVAEFFSKCTPDVAGTLAESAGYLETP